MAFLDSWSILNYTSTLYVQFFILGVGIAYKKFKNIYRNRIFIKTFVSTVLGSGTLLSCITYRKIITADPNSRFVSTIKYNCGRACMSKVREISVHIAIFVSLLRPNLTRMRKPKVVLASFVYYVKGIGWCFSVEMTHGCQEDIRISIQRIRGQCVRS